VKTQKGSIRANFNTFAYLLPKKIVHKIKLS